MGRMGQQIIRSVGSNKSFKLVALTENEKTKKRINKIKINLNEERIFKKFITKLVD